MRPVSLQMKETHCNMLQLVRIHNAHPQRLYQTRATEIRLVKYDATLKKILKKIHQNMYESYVYNTQIKVKQFRRNKSKSF